MMKILDLLLSLQIQESYVEKTKKKVVIDGKIKTITEKKKKTRRVYIKDHRITLKPASWASTPLFTLS